VDVSDPALLYIAIEPVLLLDLELGGALEDGLETDL
jgi:hypothetical protein